MVKWFVLLAGLGWMLVGCGAQTAPTSTPTPAPRLTPTTAVVDLPVLGPAPEITNEVWLNSDHPIRLSALRGEKAVLVEFWTFGCINCKRTIPWIRQWHERYAGDDFAVISVHYPEFSYERDVDNVRQALIDLDVTYPVAIDNDRVTWSAYNQRYWPTTYLIDKAGNIRYAHIGEFNERSAAEAERAIVALMGEAGQAGD